MTVSRMGQAPGLAHLAAFTSIRQLGSVADRRHLSGKLRELRFDLGGNTQRITYWLAPGCRVVLLTVFRKTKMRETAKVERARAAQEACETSHEPAAAHEVYSRDINLDSSAMIVAV
ncbi:hypothetical protein GCM10020367_18530 [Streptomyces sannanensis]|uniref:Type II toxin-antitoxin system RelE/ParE family toxin n=1 Tax=Streptomyces sannanensis TaxID=285536 RepID=A0ABP6S8Q4_9ACTN